MEFNLFLVLLLGFVFMLFMITKPKEAFYLYIIARPIIDSIDILRTKQILGAINALQAIGIVWPIALITVCLFQRAKFFKYKITNIYLVFLFLCLPSIFISASWIDAAANWLKLFTLWTVLIFVIDTIKTENDIKALFKVILISSFYPLIQFANSFVQGETLVRGDLKRFTGGYFHMGPISFILLLLTPSYLFFIEKSKSLLAKSLLILGISYIFICIYFTYYRSTLIGFLVLFLVYFVLKRKYVYLMLLLLTGILGLVSSVFLQERLAPLLGVLSHLPVLIDPLNDTYDGLLSGRFGIWRRIFTMYLYHCKFYNLFFGFGHNVIVGKYMIVPHNDYLNIFFQNGFLAMVAFIAFLSTAVSTAIRTISDNTSILLLSIVSASIAIALTTNYFVGVRVELFMGIYIAMLIRIKELDQMESRNDKS